MERSLELPYSFRYLRPPRRLYQLDAGAGDEVLVDVDVLLLLLLGATPVGPAVTVAVTVTVAAAAQLDELDSARFSGASSSLDSELTSVVVSLPVSLLLTSASGWLPVSLLTSVLVSVLTLLLTSVYSLDEDDGASSLDSLDSLAVSAAGDGDAVADVELEEVEVLLEGEARCGEAPAGDEPPV